MAFTPKPAPSVPNPTGPNPETLPPGPGTPGTTVNEPIRDNRNPPNL